MGAAVVAGGCDPKGDGGEDGGGGGGGGGGEATALQQAIDICAPWAQTYAACYAADAAQDDGYALSYVSLVGECVAEVGYYAGPGDDGCLAALQDYFACMSELDCDELIGSDVNSAGSDDAEPGGDRDGGVEVEPPCATQELAIEQQCDVASEPAVDSVPGGG